MDLGSKFADFVQHFGSFVGVGRHVEVTVPAREPQTGMAPAKPL
jgi:hypothetical protein